MKLPSPRPNRLAWPAFAIVVAVVAVVLWVQLGGTVLPWPALAAASALLAALGGAAWWRERCRSRHLAALVTQCTDEQQRAEAARQATAQRAQGIADSAPALLAYVDRERRIRFANRAYAEWFGQPRDALIGAHAPPALGARAFPLPDRALEQLWTGVPWASEDEMTRADGRQAFFLTHRQPDVQDGAVRGYWFCATDVSAVRAAERHGRELEAELGRARCEAEAAARAKTVFFSNMSHEIRTPLNTLTGLAHLMRRDAADPLAIERLDQAVAAARQLHSVVSNVLDLSRIDAGTLELDAVEFPLDVLLTRSCSLVAEAARRKGLELVIDAGYGPQLVRADLARLVQAIGQLLNNAVKFTEAGSVTLKAEIDGPTDGVVPLRFEVRDTGIGIAPDRLEGLFTAFEQADGSLTRRHGGAGLGLALTRHLVHLMGGQVGAESVPGQGSLFWIELRLPVAGDSPAGPQAAAPLQGRRVLLVDDLADVRLALTEMLRKLGLRVEAAASGTEALVLAERAEAEADAYEVAIVDWLMPGMDGVETARALLAQAGAVQPAIVFLSAAVDDELIAEARALDAAGLLQKPLSFSALHGQLLRLVIDAEDMPAAPAAHDDAAWRERLGGARVLLAEDHPVNQRVAAKLLRSVGMAVDLAQDGAEAVAQARRNRYDAILMDVQMPVMDGLEAVRRIRALPGGRHVPIVAMTANAFSEDQAATRGAGMDGHLTKPVEPAQLYATLARVLAATRVPRLSRTPASGFAESRLGGLEESLRGIEGLDAARGLRFFAGDESEYHAALLQFADLYGAGLPGAAEAETANAGSDVGERWRREVHAVGGAAATIGAVRLQAEAAALEQALASGLPGSARPLHQALRDFSARLGSALRH